MQIRVRHTTHYQFETPLPYGLQRLRLMPKSRAGQQVVSWQTSIDHGTIELSYVDHHNNQVQLASLKDGTTEFQITSEGVVETSDNGGIIGMHGGFIPLWMFLRPTPLTLAGPKIQALADEIQNPQTIEAMHHLSSTILEAMPYQIQGTNVTATSEESLGQGYGVCMDHAHVFIAAARHLGVPARYVSGYLYVDGTDDHTASQEASHAWAEAYLPVIGWVGFDISNGISPDQRYVRMATGFDYQDAAPLLGISFGGDHNEKLVVSVQVQQ